MSEIELLQNRIKELEEKLNIKEKKTRKYKEKTDEQKQKWREYVNNRNQKKREQEWLLTHETLDDFTLKKRGRKNKSQ